MDETAGQQPAASSSLAVAPDHLERSTRFLSASEAERRFGINRHTLIDLAKAGYARGSIDPGDGRGTWRFDPDELAEDLLRLPTCQYEGCERFGLGSNGGCTKHDHVLARRARVAELRGRGLSTPAIGRELGFSAQTVCDDLIALGLDSSWQGRWNGLISASEAERCFGLDRHTLVLAAEEGLVRAYRREATGLGRDGVAWFFDPAELVEDVDCLPTCGYEGCNRRALGPSGGCEAHGHVLAGPRARGVKRPDIGPKISAGKIGRPRPDASERWSESYRTGVGIWAGIAKRTWRPLKYVREDAPGWLRSIVIGRREGPKYGALGGPKTGYTDKQERKVLELRTKGLSIRATARIAKVSRRQVEGIEARHKSVT